MTQIIVIVIKIRGHVLCGQVWMHKTPICYIYEPAFYNFPPFTVQILLLSKSCFPTVLLLYVSKELGQWFLRYAILKITHFFHFLLTSTA